MPTPTMTVDQMLGTDMTDAELTKQMKFIATPASGCVWIVDFHRSADPANWELYVANEKTDGTLDKQTVIFAADVENWEGTMWEDTEPTHAQIQAATETIGNTIRLIYG